MTPEKIALGEKLFFDPILSGNMGMPCSACHAPAAGWAVQDKISFGYPGTTHWRNSQTIINSAYYGKLFWAVSVGEGTPYASFVKRNNAAGYLNLCLAAAVGFVAYMLAAKKARDGRDLPMHEDATWMDHMRVHVRTVLLVFADLNAVKLALFTGGACILTGIVCSLSRGGWLASISRRPSSGSSP